MLCSIVTSLVSLTLKWSNPTSLNKKIPADAGIFFVCYLDLHKPLYFKKGPVWIDDDKMSS